jgi:hypothetical protein
MNMTLGITMQILTCLCLARAGATVLYTSITQDTLFVGDPVELTISMVTPLGANIIPPETDNGFGTFTVKSWDTGRIPRKSSDSLTFKYLITTYTVDSCSLPRLRFIEVKPQGNDTLYSDSLPMRAVSVIVADSGDTIRMKDIKPVLKAGTMSLTWLWIVLGAAWAVAGAVLGRYWWLKSRKAPPPPPPKPPYDEAIEALAALQQKDLPAKGLIREYVFELSEILKRYIGRRFECGAAEYTTDEMVLWLPFAPFEKELCASMHWFFTTTHPVKFAKLIPDRSTVKKLYDETVQFIEKTKPRAVQVQVAPQSEQEQGEAR